MKKFIRNFVFCLLILSVSISGLIFGVNFSKISKSSAIEQFAIETPTNSDVSIFIRKPTFSIFYNNKIFFIDDADKLLKSYNTQTSAFDASYIDLSSYKIVNTTFIGDDWYLLVEGQENMNKVVKIDLAEFVIIDETDFNLEIDNKYSSLFAQKINFEEKDYTLISFSAERENTVIVLINEETGEIETPFEIKLGDAHNDIKDSLLKTISFQDSNGKLHIVFIYDKDIAYYSTTSIDGLRDLADEGVVINTIQDTTIPDVQQLIIKNITFAKIADKDYIAISFCTGTNQQHIKFYSFDFDNHINTIKYETSAPCKNAEWINFNENYFSYVNGDEQKLFLTNLSATGDVEITYSYSTDEIDNPQYEIEYFEDFEFIYKKANALTEIYSDPWGSNSNIFVNEGTNVIQIGKAKLVGSGSEIKDYDYCLYTYESSNNTGINRCGFIETSKLDKKAEITPTEAGYIDRMSIWPRTTLYSLPTTVISGKIGGDTSSLNSEIIMDIEDNSEIEVLDVLCNYIANNVQMIKVQVNKNQVGYIDAKCIRKPSDIKNFVITNATIQKDDTIIYLSDSLDSTTLSFKLNKGKTVRINGARNTKTGLTSITFNDEYGNEFSGYIETDYIKSDSWSTLQIIGCVLIAINIGLLVLILIYKKNHLGNRGQKIEKE